MQRDAYQKVAAIEDCHWWFVGRRRILASLLDSFELRRDAMVLEVGCGTGGNLPLFARYGRVHALEMDASAARIAAARGVAVVASGRLPDQIPFDGLRFDLVAMLDVLEHVVHDTGALRALAPYVASGGRLVVTVPAYQFLWSAHDVYSHHARRYTAGRLAHTLHTAGFDVLRVSYFNTLLFPALALSRLLQRLAPVRPGADMDATPQLCNRPLAALFASERHLLRRMRLPFGLSILAVARVGGSSSSFHPST